MKRHIPQIITLMNLFCGCVAVVFAVLNKLEWAAFFVFLGIFFDFFDGLAARLLNAQSELGVQLDSLADMVTSGLVPGIVMFQLLAMSQSGGWNLELGEASADSTHHAISISVLPFLGFLITLASAYRLAKFNLDEDQLTSFIGLPTPANALLILSLPLILLNHNSDYINEIILNPWFLVVLTVLSCILLNARIPLFALKFKNWAFKDNAHRYIFLILSLVLLFTVRYLAIPAIVFLYLVSSLLFNLGAKENKSV